MAARQPYGPNPGFGQPAQRSRQPSDYSSAPTAPDTTFKQNVNRQKTKRWVEAAKYSYDGDDWGEEEEPYEEDEEPEPAVVQQATKVNNQPKAFMRPADIYKRMEVEQQRERERERAKMIPAAEHGDVAEDEQEKMKMPAPIQSQVQTPVQMQTPVPTQMPAQMHMQAPMQAPPQTLMPVQALMPQPIPTPMHPPTEAQMPVQTPTLDPMLAQMKTQAPMQAPMPMETKMPIQKQMAVETQSPVQAPVPTQMPAQVQMQTPMPTPIPTAMPTQMEAPMQKQMPMQTQTPSQMQTPMKIQKSELPLQPIASSIQTTPTEMARRPDAVEPPLLHDDFDDLPKPLQVKRQSVVPLQHNPVVSPEPQPLVAEKSSTGGVIVPPVIPEHNHTLPPKVDPGAGLGLGSGPDSRPLPQRTPSPTKSTDQYAPGPSRSQIPEIAPISHAPDPVDDYPPPVMSATISSLGHDDLFSPSVMSAQQIAGTITPVHPMNARVKNDRNRTMADQESGPKRIEEPVKPNLLTRFSWEQDGKEEVLQAGPPSESVQHQPISGHMAPVIPLPVNMGAPLHLEGVREQKHVGEQDNISPSDGRVMTTSQPSAIVDERSTHTNTSAHPDSSLPLGPSGHLDTDSQPHPPAHLDAPGHLNTSTPLDAPTHLDETRMLHSSEAHPSNVGPLPDAHQPGPPPATTLHDPRISPDPSERTHRSSQPSSLLPDSASHDLVQIPAKPPVNAAKGPILSFRETMAIPGTQDRIRALDHTRDTFAGMDSGLSNWIQMMAARDPLPAMNPRLQPSPIGQPFDQPRLNHPGTDLSRHRQYTDPPPFNSSNSNSNYQTPSSVQHRPQQSQSNTTIPGGFSPSGGGGRFSSKLHSAGAGAKGLFAKGRNRLRNSGGNREVFE